MEGGGEVEGGRDAFHRHADKAELAKGSTRLDEVARDIDHGVAGEGEGDDGFGSAVH